MSFAFGNWLNSIQCITNSALDFQQRSMGVPSTVDYLDYWEARTICIDPYWVNQWLKNYSAGIVKRGLLGTGLGTLSPGEINILLLNLICFLIPIAIFTLMALAIRKHTSRSWPLISAFLAITALTPFGKVLAETNGDPLQVVCLISLIALTILSRFRHHLSEWIMGLGIAATYLITILIYEGSFLLLLPMLLISKGRIARLVSLVSIGLGAALIWHFSGAESSETGSLIASSYSGYNPITEHSIRYIHSQNLATSASFFFNVKQEFSKYIEDPYGSIRWIGTAAVMSLFFMLSFAKFFIPSQRQNPPPIHQKLVSRQPLWAAIFPDHSRLVSLRNHHGHLGRGFTDSRFSLQGTRTTGATSSQRPPLSSLFCFCSSPSQL